MRFFQFRIIGHCFGEENPRLFSIAHFPKAMTNPEVTVARWFILPNALFVGLHRIIESLQMLKDPCFLETCSRKLRIDQQAVVYGPKRPLIIFFSRKGCRKMEPGLFRIGFLIDELLEESDSFLFLSQGLKAMGQVEERYLVFRIHSQHVLVQLHCFLVCPQHLMLIGHQDQHFFRELMPGIGLAIHADGLFVGAFFTEQSSAGKQELRIFWIHPLCTVQSPKRLFILIVGEQELCAFDRKLEEKGNTSSPISAAFSALLIFPEEK